MEENTEKLRNRGYRSSRVPWELLFVLARVGIFLLADLFATFAGIFLCSGLSSLLGVIFKGNKTVVLSVLPAINDPATSSALGWIILTGIMLRLFWDDGKRHTAYARFSLPVATAAVFFMFAAYWLPSVFAEQSKESVAAVLNSFYKPCMWLSGPLQGQLRAAVAICAAAVAFLCLLIYKISGDVYLKRHENL